MNDLTLLLALWAICGQLNLREIPVPKNGSTGVLIRDSTFVVQVNASLKPFYVHLTEREDTTDGYTRWYHEFRVSQDTLGDSAQIINLESNFPFTSLTDGDSPGIEFVDANFDGFKDIKVFGYQPIDASKCYDIYLFRPLQNKFVYWEPFPHAFCGDKFSFDTDNKQIQRSAWWLVVGLWSEETYKVQGDTLILIEKILHQPDTDHPGEFLLIKQEMVNDTLTIVSKQRVTR